MRGAGVHRRGEAEGGGTQLGEGADSDRCGRLPSCERCHGKHQQTNNKNIRGHDLCGGQCALLNWSRMCNGSKWLMVLVTISPKVLKSRSFWWPEKVQTPEWPKGSRRPHGPDTRI